MGWLTGLLDRDPNHLHKQSRYYWLEIALRHLEIIAWHGFSASWFFGRWQLHLPMRRLSAIAPAEGLLFRRQATE